MVTHDSLTEREREILAFLADNLSDREIASRLHLATKTIKWYNSQLYSKLGVSNRREAVEQAQLLGLLDVAGDDLPDVQTRHNLPGQTTPFIGRQQELTDLAQLIANPDTRLMTILAPGGMGKTRLALAAAEQQLRHFADGVYFVPLAPLRAPDDIVTAIAESVGFSFYGGEPPQKQLVGYFRERNTLLLMDNFEHLLDGTSLVSDLLKAASGVTVLATSREKLNLTSETVFTLSGLHFPDWETPEDALEYDAVKLFMQSAHRVRPDFELLASDLDTLAHICHLTEGLPLALVLAAGWVDVLSLERIASEIQQGIDILETEMRDVPERHRSVHATFERTWNRMTDDERVIFGNLSVFRGGFTAEAAQAVAAADARHLRGLAQKALIQTEGSERFVIHELLRQFAADKLDQAGETRLIAQHHLDYFISLADEAEKHHFGHEQVIWFDRLEADIENIRSALAFSLAANETEKGLQLAGLMAAFWSVRNYVVEARDWLVRLLTIDKVAPAKLRAGALYQAARLIGAMGDTQVARTYGEEAVALARSLNDPSLLAWSLLNLGTFTDLRLDLPRAAAALEESLALFRSVDDPHGVNNALRIQSDNAIHQGKFAYARQLIDEVLRHSSDGGHTIGLAHGHELIGVISWTQDKNAVLSRTHFKESRSQYLEAGVSVSAARVCVSLALVEFESGNHADTQQLFQEAYRLLKQRGYLRWAVADYILVGLGIVANKLGHHHRAVIMFAAAEPGVKSDTIWLQSTFVNSYNSDVATLRHDAAFTEAWKTGKAMTREQAFDFALEIIMSIVSTPNM